MRIVALLAQLVVAVASGGAFAWWAATVGMRLMVRRLEHSRPLRRGPLPACAAVLLGLALAVSAIVVLVALDLFRLLVSAPDWIGVQRPWAVWAWKGLMVLAAALLALAGTWAAFREALVALGAARRRWYLTDGPHPPSEAEPVSLPEPPRSGSRSIVILCDGTSNRPDQQEDGEAAATNVWKLYKALGCDETQVTWYQAGVGSDTSSTAAEVRRTKAVLASVGANPGSQVAAYGGRILRLFEGAFGSGISEGIVNGYTEIVRQYRPGDRIYLIGFSRGAYTARCIAGVISRCGLLRSENLRHAPDMVQLYRTREDQHAFVHVRPELVHADPSIEFVGVFDTVAALGVPLWGWWFRASPIWKIGALATDPVEACRHVYHALAMDERRSQFFPTLYNDPRHNGGGKRGPRDRLKTLEQVWFRGAHADIGGGYARHDLSDITLGWMMDAMRHHGLRFHDGTRDALRPDPLGRLHDELARKPGWVLFGSWPRWHPVPGAVPDQQGTTLHPSVLERADAVQERTGRPDLVRLQPGASLAFVAEARRDWNRTGVVIEHGATYRLTYLGSRWRDAETPPCAPDGQEAQGVFDLRRWLTAGRRLRWQPWMRLVATVAHPRKWELREKGLPELVELLFHNDPWELTRQLAAIGQDLATPDMSVLIHNEAPAGVMYLFANDWWQTASNNSGGAWLRIAHVTAAEEGPPLWTLRVDGGWSRDGQCVGDSRRAHLRPHA